MKNYKKRTISLCLASLLTVLGASCSDLYNNHLMSLDIKNDTKETITVTAYTQKAFHSQLKTFQRNANTHVIIIPDTDSKISKPDIKNPTIKSVNIETFPYTYDQKGYTKITIETDGSKYVETKTMLYVPASEPTKQIAQKSYWDTNESNAKTNNVSNNEKITEPIENKIVSQSNASQNTPPLTETGFEKTNNYDNPKSSGKKEPIAVFLCGSILMLIVGFILLIGKDKVASIVGEQNQIDLSPDSDNKTQENKNKKNIRKTINSLDKTYSTKKNFTPAQKPVKTETEEIKTNIVNLDELYNAKNNQNTQTETIEESSNDEDDLADFLNEFTFNEEEPQEEELYNEELYNEVLANEELKFSEEDIHKLDKLLKLEISPETQDSLAEYLEKQIKKPKPLTPKQIFEDLVTTYSIKQNITFTAEDIKAIKDIMNVEIDKDFITDLKTNPNRVKEVEKEIQTPKEHKQKKSDILTLNVKDLLPNLSEELKRQRNKEIKSEVKPEVVYYSEGYEYQKLSVSDDLANISKALSSKDATQHKESYSAPIVETGYDVSTLTIHDKLPDLEDVRKNPQKYQEKKGKVKIDEKALLKSISNVTFKPFYEEVQDEMNQFNNFEIIDENIEETSNKTPNNKYKAKINIDAQNLLNLIEKQKLTQKLKEQEKLTQQSHLEPVPQASSKESQTKQIFDNDIIKTILITKDAECSLIKTKNGYDIVGYINDKKFNLKHYDSLKTTNMQIRAHEKNKQYLIKLGLHKFVINITDDNMEFVMDLC